MRDQADQLRALVRSAAHSHGLPGVPPPQKVVIGGSKGGVGTTTMAVNLAVAFARLGKRVVLVDADMQRGDVARLFGVEPRETIADVLAGHRTVHEALHRGPNGVQVLPGLWSASRVPDCSPGAQERLLSELDRLGRHADVVVLDVGSGLNHVVRRFWHAADQVVLVTTADKIAMMDGYAAIKVLAGGDRRPPVYTLVNQADEDQAVQVVARINRACERFLDRSVQLAGHVVHDRTVADAAAAERPYLNRAPEAIAARSLESIAERLLSATARNSDGRSEADSKLGSAAA